MTLQNLDNSAQVKQLQSRMGQINDGLTGDLDKLKQLEAFAATVAKVADTIAQVAAKLASLAAGAAIQRRASEAHSSVFKATLKDLSESDPVEAGYLRETLVVTTVEFGLSTVKSQGRSIS